MTLKVNVTVNKELMALLKNKANGPDAQGDVYAYQWTPGQERGELRFWHGRPSEYSEPIFARVNYNPPPMWGDYMQERGLVIDVHATPVEPDAPAQEQIGAGDDLSTNT